MDNDEYECVCDWLRLKWLPVENPSAAKLARYPDRYRWDHEKPADSERGRQSRTNVL